MGGEAMEQILRNIDGDTKLYRTSETKVAFADVVRMAMTAEEVKVIFGVRDFDDPQTAAVTSVLVLTPGHMKRLSEKMREAVLSYEETFGAIEADPR